MEKGLVSVIVVDWRSNELLKKCLNSIFSQTYKNLEVILIENEPKETSLQYIKDSFPQVKIMINRENLFYASSQNQGISLAKGEFILSLNNDVVLDNFFLEEIVKAMEKDERIGMVSGKILSFDKERIDSCGQLLSRSCRPIERGYQQKDNGQFNESGFIFGVCGACSLYRKKMLEEIKLNNNEYFDCDYGMFYEDLDLNWRANLKGWKAYYNYKAVAYHLRGSSAKIFKPRLNLLKKFEFFSLLPEYKLMLLRNRYMTIIKNQTLEGFLRNFFFIFLYDFLIWIYIVLFEPSLIFRFGREIKFLFKAFEKRRRWKKW